MSGGQRVPALASKFARLVDYDKRGSEASCLIRAVRGGPCARCFVK